MRLGNVQSIRRSSKSRFVRAVLLAWVLSIGIDFFFNAGVLAPIWESPLPFLLPARDLALRIPLGYGAFLLFALTVVWLLSRLGVREPRAGAVFGVQLGLLTSAASMLGLVSISTVSAVLGTAWGVLQVLLFAASGYVGAWALGAERLRPVATRTGLVAAGLVVAGVVAQNLVSNL